MSTFLQLCQDVARESGTVPLKSTPLPLSVTSQIGRLNKIVNWVAQANRLIESDRNAWQWMRKEWSGSLTASTAKYTPASFSITDLARWIGDDPGRYRPTWLYETAVGVTDEGPIEQISWPSWLSKYGRGYSDPNRPVHYAISPANQICFGPTPDKTYSVRGEYYRAPQTLAANDDVPGMPDMFHQIIVYRALMLLNQHDETAAGLTVNAAEYKRLMWDLERDQLPAIVIGSRPIA